MTLQYLKPTLGVTTSFSLYDAARNVSLSPPLLLPLTGVPPEVSFSKLDLSWTLVMATTIVVRNEQNALISPTMLPGAVNGTFLGTFTIQCL